MENRTDLAFEAQEYWKAEKERGQSLPGISVKEEKIDGFQVTRVIVENEEGGKMLCKPMGKYDTLSIDPFLRRENDSFEKGVLLTSKLLRRMIPRERNQLALVVGLGNVQITPDALGPFTARHILVTRHLIRQAPEQFASFRSVCALETGVLGTTGLESTEMVDYICKSLCPDIVIAVDALAGNTMNRLCRTVQISDTGIVPGSGIGNYRLALSQKTLQIPVVAIGIPTVCNPAGNIKGEFEDSMIITPRNIDAEVRDLSRFLGYSINLALHDGLTVSDIDMLIS